MALPVEDGVLQPPPFGSAGWWADGPEPGEDGPALGRVVVGVAALGHGRLAAQLDPAAFVDAVREGYRQVGEGAANRTGPHLNGIMGREIGAVMGHRGVGWMERPERAGPVMTWSKFTDLLNLRSLWTPDRVVLFLDRQQVPAAQYCDVLDEGGRHVQRPAPAKIAAWVQRGASVIVNDVGSLLPGLRTWVATLAWATGGNVQVNIYASRAEHQAFAPHFDTHEVFALHCEGEKVWRIYDLRAEHPINHPSFKRAAVPPDMPKFLEREVTMTPGDVVYIPRGTYHEALASSYGSLHVTFGVTRPVGLDLLSALWGRLVTEKRLREAVPLACGLTPDGDGAFGDYLRDVTAALSRVAGDAKVQALLRDQMRTFAAREAQVDEAVFRGDG